MKQKLIAFLLLAIMSIFVVSGCTSTLQQTTSFSDGSGIVLELGKEVKVIELS